MSLDKSIEHGKEHRKQYFKYCEQIDPSCRPHGGCEWCNNNRHYRSNKEEERCKYEENEYEKNTD